MAKTLLQKLGYAPGRAARVLGTPDELAPLLADLRLADPPDWLLGFCPTAAAVAAVAEPLLAAYRRGGHLWLAYPKRSGRLASALSRAHGWAPLVSAGLLPVTQVALDADWSALRWRHRDEIQTLTRRFETR